LEDQVVGGGRVVGFQGAQACVGDLPVAVPHDRRADLLGEAGGVFAAARVRHHGDAHRRQIALSFRGIVLRYPAVRASTWPPRHSAAAASSEVCAAARGRCSEGSGVSRYSSVERRHTTSRMRGQSGVWCSTDSSRTASKSPRPSIWSASRRWLMTVMRSLATCLRGGWSSTATTWASKSSTSRTAKYPA